MARTLNKLTDTSVKAQKAVGRVSDGGGLYLSVSVAGAKSWVFMWTPPGGKRREMGLGPYPAVSLAAARTKAAKHREQIAAGLDPIAIRDQRPEPTFEECTKQFIESVESEWRNEKHRWQWGQTLSAPCAAILKKRVSQITTEDILKVLKPIWTTKGETASRIRGRIERVLNFAKVKGWRSGENPAAWHGNLENLLPKRQRLARGHHPAMPYAEVPAFMTELRANGSLAARALEFTILTASRSGEALGATWDEVDFEKKLWTVPAKRMKAGKAHVVPLTDPALAMLKDLKAIAVTDYIFPSGRPTKYKAEVRPLTTMAVLKCLRRLSAAGLTVHGFRSSFRDWAGDVTSYPREVAEAALAHQIGNAVEQAYRRSSALEKRRKLMEAWATFCFGVPRDNVLTFGRP